MMSKQLVTVALLVTLAAVAVNAISLTVGSRQSGDFEASAPVAVKVKAVAGKRAVSVQNVNTSPYVITAIYAQDLENKAAIASVTMGGPGSKSVSVYFQSEPGAGLNYVLHIYVKKA